MNQAARPRGEPVVANFRPPAPRRAMAVKPTGDEERLVLPCVGRRRPVGMTAEINVRQPRFFAGPTAKARQEAQDN